MEGIGRVEEALGRGKRRYLKRRGMATADGVSREPTVWGRAPPQGLRGIAAGEEVEEVGAGRERVYWGFGRALRVWSSWWDWEEQGGGKAHNCGRESGGGESLE